jgi:hypothetical protein
LAAYPSASSAGVANPPQVLAGTSPSVALLPDGTKRVVFVGSDGLLWQQAPNGAVSHVLAGQFTLSVAPGTSPAIAVNGSSGWEIAFQAPDHHLWTASDGGVGDTGAVMAAGSNPALVYLPKAGGYEIAFVGSDNQLWRAFPETNWFLAGPGFSALPVAAGTSPAIASDGTDFKIAFQGSDGQLKTVTSTALVNTGAFMAPGTSPSLGYLRTLGGYEIAFVGPDNDLWRAFPDTNWFHAGPGFSALDVAPGTSPAVGVENGGAWHISFHGPHDHLWTYNSNDTATDIRMPMPPVIAPPSLDSVRVSGTSVTIGWTDRSSNEDTFQVTRRTANGAPQLVKETATRNRSSQGDTYSYTDTITAGTRQCYEIVDTNQVGPTNYSNELCTSPPTLPAPPAAGTGIISIPDTEADSGRSPSVATGADGLGIASYFAHTHLRVAHCNDTACTSMSTHDIETLGSSIWSSIKIGADGLPLISYVKYLDDQNVNVYDLRVAHCADRVCSSATITTLDAAADVHANTALTIAADGFGTIAYEDSAQQSIKVAHCLNAACTNASTRTIGTGGFASDTGTPGALSVATNPIGGVSIAYNTGLPSWSLQLVTCTDPGCAHIASQVNIEPSSSPAPGQTNAAIGPSIVYGLDGLPLLSFGVGLTVNAASDLVVAHCSNVYCTLSNPVSVHTGASTGWFTSVAIGGDGLGVVSYSDHTNLNVEVAHCADLACSGVTHGILDEFGAQGSTGTALAIGSDGLPLITYQDNTTNVFRVVHCGNVTCGGEIIAPF